jgi:hypothetical protein
MNNSFAQAVSLQEAPPGVVVSTAQGERAIGIGRHNTVRTAHAAPFYVRTLSD